MQSVLNIVGWLGSALVFGAVFRWKRGMYLLGHGGVGLALGAQLKGTAEKTYAIVGDGEINEGPIWEGALFAA